MTTKFDNFKAALEALCEEHGVMLDAGNKNLIVWDNPYNPMTSFVMRICIFRMRQEVGN